MDVKRTKVDTKVLLMVLAIFTKLWECAAIANNGQRNFRHIPASSPSDQLLEWELGLREAVTQVLERHHYAPDLRLRVLSAPMMHRQKATTPFGDISTLAKGRLYATPGGGFEFVQEDDDDRGCGPCARCNRVMCEDIYSGDPTHLLALWTVKRLRHRTHYGGFNYETEYTVSPVDDITEAIRDGRFDYSLPGHVFVVKQKEAPGSTFPETYNRKIPTDLFKPDVIIGIDNYGNRHILKTYHPFFTSPTQQQPVSTPPENQEIELYKILLKTLASKTSTTPSDEGPFRVSLNHYIPPPPPSLPTSPGVETKPPKQGDSVGDVTQPVKTTVHYFMPVGEVLMTTKKIEGSTPKTMAVTEKSKTTKKPSLLTPKTKTPMFVTPKRPTIGLIPEEESEEESVDLFPGPEEVGRNNTKLAPMATTEKSKTTKKPSLLTPKTKTPTFVTPKRPTIGLVPEEESEEESDELFPEPAESGSSTTKNITKPPTSGTTQKTSSTANIPTTKFLIKPQSEEESEDELFAEPVEATKSTAASTTKLTTKAVTKQTTKRQKLTTTRSTTKQEVPSTKPEIVTTKLTSSTSLRTTTPMNPETTPSMTSIESSTVIVPPSQATTSAKPTSPKTTRKYRKRPTYASTITKVQKPATTKSTTTSTIAQISTMKTQTTPRPTKPKPTVQSTTEEKTVSATAVLPEPSTEAMTIQTQATSTLTTYHTIPVTSATSTSTLSTLTTSYLTQPGLTKTSLVTSTFKLPPSEMLPEVLPTLTMTVTTQKVDVTVPNQMQMPTEIGTTSPYQTTTQSSARTEADRDRETPAIETTSEIYDKSTTEIDEATKTGTTFHSTSEVSRETTNIYTTPQTTEKPVSTTIPCTTQTVYTQKPSPLEATAAFNTTTTILSSESERTSILKDTIATIKTTEAATDTTTGSSEFISTQATTPAKTTVTRISTATETTETTFMEKVTVTPIYVEMTTPSIISTETSTIPTSSTVKQTTADTFLIDRKSTKPTSKRPTGEVNEDDIFGIPLPTSTTTTTKLPMKFVPKGFDDLFDNLEEPQNAKVIFSDFYEASTSPTPTQSTSEMNQPLTSQSYETSISFRVNKRDRTQFQPSTANPRSDTWRNPEQLLQQQALQLVNHARSIEYLNQDTGDKPVRSSKYKRRRGYVSRTKKLVSKRKRISRDRNVNSQGT